MAMTFDEYKQKTTDLAKKVDGIREWMDEDEKSLPDNTREVLESNEDVIAGLVSAKFAQLTAEYLGVELQNESKAVS